MAETRKIIAVAATAAMRHSIELQAKAEGRSVSNLSERLLSWALEQLGNVGDSNALLQCRAQISAKIPLRVGKPFERVVVERSLKVVVAHLHKRELVAVGASQ